MHIERALCEAALFDAVRMAGTGITEEERLRQINAVKFAFIAFVAPGDEAFRARALSRLAVYTKRERIAEPPGDVVVIITGITESGEQIMLRAQKARKLGARFVAVVVPHLIRMDRVPDYVGSVDVAFYTPSFIGSEFRTAGHGRCFMLQPQPLRLS